MTQPNDHLGALLDAVTLAAYEWGRAKIHEDRDVAIGAHAMAVLAVRRNVEALQADADRLDWLETTVRDGRCAVTLDLTRSSDIGLWWCDGTAADRVVDGDTLRAAIDAARPAPPTGATP